jgi:hypothetical protein
MDPRVISETPPPDETTEVTREEFNSDTAQYNGIISLPPEDANRAIEEFTMGRASMRNLRRENQDRVPQLDENTPRLEYVDDGPWRIVSETETETTVVPPMDMPVETLITSGREIFEFADFDKLPVGEPIKSVHILKLGDPATFEKTKKGLRLIKKGVVSSYKIKFQGGREISVNEEE